MDTEGKPPNQDLADELDSLRREIAHLQKLIREKETGVPPAEPSTNPPAAVPSLEQGLFGLALVDAEGRILKPNSALAGLLGYTVPQAEQLRLTDIVRNPETVLGLARQVLEGALPGAKFEEELTGSSGESFWVQVTLSANPEGSGTCLLLVDNIDTRKYVVRALQHEKQLLEGLINSSLDGILAFDRELFYTVWNPGMERICGISANDALGRHALEVWPGLKDLGEDVHMAAALEGQKTISRDRFFISRAGKRVYYEGYYGPIHDPRSNEVTGGLAIIRDVTERRQAEEARRLSEERYRELFENAHDMIYTHDLAGRITSINRAAERITGYSRAEALRMRFGQFVAPEYQQIARRMIDRQITDEAPATGELDIITKSGSRVMLEVSTRLIFHEGRPVGVQGIARDITGRKKTEQALQQANQKLEGWVRELEQRTREMTLLSEMGDILRACLTTEEVYEVIVRSAQEIFPDQAGVLFVMGPSRSVVEAAAQWGDVSRIELTFTPDDCWGLRRGRVHWVEDSGSGLLCKHFHTPPPSGYLCVPMMAQSEAVGVLHLVQSEGGRMSEARRRLAMTMGEHVAMALSNLRLHETLRNQSIRDQTTGLFNRSFMEESLELELRRASRSQAPLSVVMLEIDNFQQIHDDFGRDVGDSILRRTSMLIQANVRKGDVACRYSDHAFAIILPGSGDEVTRRRAQSICDLTRALELKHQNAQFGRVSASVGLSVFPLHGQTVESLLRSAEAALNRAKGSGGNCVVVAI